MEGVMWGCVAQYWKNLVNDLASRCECFAFTTHMGDVWSGSSPVKGKRKPKGKGVLQELASLYLYLERRPIEGVLPAKPIGYLDKPYCKNRVARFVVKDDEVEIIDVLPPRIPDCTPNKIEWYIENPIGLKYKLDISEKAFDEVMSEDDKLKLKLEVAEAERDIEQIKLDRLEKLEDMAMAGLTEGKATEEQLKQLLELREKVLPRLGSNEKEQVDKWREALANRGASSASELSVEKASELIEKMKGLV
jgi:hypothetical protein